MPLCLSQKWWEVFFYCWIGTNNASLFCFAFHIENNFQTTALAAPVHCSFAAFYCRNLWHKKQNCWLHFHEILSVNLPIFCHSSEYLHFGEKHQNSLLLLQAVPTILC